METLGNFPLCQFSHGQFSLRAIFRRAIFLRAIFSVPPQPSGNTKHDNGC